VPARPLPEGSGLRGMSERLSAVGGSLELRPDQRPGFCLIATVPAAPARVDALP
jgi:signal transduction histidine kinase